MRPQNQGSLRSVGLAVITVRASADQIIELARLSDVNGAGRVRLTTGQDAIISDAAADEVATLLGEPLLGEFPPAPSPWFRRLVA